MNANTAASVRDCPTCGMAREDWPDDANGGHVKGGVSHCCRGCVEGTGCTCKVVAGGGPAPTQDEIRQDAASGELVQSLQHQTDTVDPADYGTDVTTKKPQQSATGGPA